MPPSRGADRIGVSLGSHRPTVILKLPCLVEKKRTKVRSLAVLFSVANWDRSPASVGGSLPLPGPSGQASGAEFEEDHFGIDVLLESWEKSTETGTSVDQPEPEPGHVPPAIQVAPRGNEAGPSNQPPRVVPYPYQLDEVIGGDSVQSIQQRLLAKYSYTPPIGIMYLAEIEAKDLFEVKVEILRIMAVLDPYSPASSLFSG
uniref:DUF8018 domain-containing protein n=1 Tax=Solanum tuberosum TaxID=4113 RepID=M1DLI2_SOLTU